MIVVVGASGGQEREGSAHILHEWGQSYFWEGNGSLSIKSFFGGRALYDVGGGRYAVDDGCYLILNHDQPYSISIESTRAVESFCLFFQPGFVEEILRSQRSNLMALLDDPAPPASRPLHFFERTYPHDDLLSPALFRLRTSLDRRKQDRAWLGEQLHGLVERLLWRHQQVRREVETLPAARPATREELYRRCHLARDYIEACFDQSLTLEEIARVASLSPNHLLRSFKQLFCQTPYQYLTGRRLAEAQRLLLLTEQSVTEICLAVGFESLGSFSWLFRRRVGISPEGYRRQFGDFREALPLLPLYPDG